jgi:hypothetical protein
MRRLFQVTSAIGILCDIQAPEKHDNCVSRLRPERTKSRAAQFGLRQRGDLGNGPRAACWRRRSGSDYHFVAAACGRRLCYLAAADLIPELQHDRSLSALAVQTSHVGGHRTDGASNFHRMTRYRGSRICQLELSNDDERTHHIMLLVFQDVAVPDVLVRFLTGQ